MFCTWIGLLKRGVYHLLTFSASRIWRKMKCSVISLQDFVLLSILVRKVLSHLICTSHHAAHLSQCHSENRNLILTQRLFAVWAFVIIGGAVLWERRLVRSMCRCQFINHVIARVGTKFGLRLWAMFGKNGSKFSHESHPEFLAGTIFGADHRKTFCATRSNTFMISSFADSSKL